MVDKNAEVWAREVLDVLKLRPKLFKRVIAHTSASAPNEAPAGGMPLLEWLRGDEARDVFEWGDPAETYAEFLLGEWRPFNLS